MSYELDESALRGLLPERPEAGHKGTFGHLFVIAGSRGFSGAARLACEAAGRSGAGLVTAGVPYPLGNVIAAGPAEMMSLLLPSTEEESLALDALEPAIAFARNKTAVTLGPGLSRNPETVQFVLDFVPQCPVPMVLDADALNALSEGPTVFEDLQAPALLTPHPGEMARLLNSPVEAVQSDREGAARRLAEENGCVVVLKGHRSVIASSDGRMAINPTGNHGLAKGGTGDVLAGLLGGLLAQGMAAFDAASLGVFVQGRAGDLAAARKTPRGMTASDVIACLPEAWHELEGA